jgi:putative Mn2+ efflux pump MntP
MRRILDAIIGFAKFTIVLILVWWYIETWIESFKERKWLKFILLSIIPCMMIWEIITTETKRSRYIHHPVVNNPSLIRR